MVLKLRHLAVVLLGGLGLCGCLPTATSQLDEQKNPYYLAGKERAASRDYKGAIEAFEKALEVNPRSALAHFELGVLYDQRENDYAAAIYHYNKVLQLRPRGEYPAENAKLRIPACKQEMVKMDTLTTSNPTALQEFERLREENQQLRKQIEYLNAQLQSRLTATPQPGAAQARQGQTPSPVPRLTGTPTRPGQTNLVRSAAPPPSRSPVPAARPAAAGMRTHIVKPNETLAGIARQYGVKLDALMAANPGVDPKRLKVGVSVNVPSS